jgi:hypothetical protein
MDKDFRNHLHVWTLEKIKANPQKFGGDNSNPLIMQEYSNEFFSDNRVIQLETKFYSLLSTVSRIKNKLLRNHPQFDCRKKHKPKNALKNVKNAS